jgi:hypothetical protein
MLALELLRDSFVSGAFSSYGRSIPVMRAPVMALATFAMGRYA